MACVKICGRMRFLDWRLSLFVSEALRLLHSLMNIVYKFTELQERCICMHMIITHGEQSNLTMVLAVDVGIIQNGGNIVMNYVYHLKQ